MDADDDLDISQLRDIRDALEARYAEILILRAEVLRLGAERDAERALADDLWTVHNMPIDHPDRDAENRRVAARYRKARQQ